jgi:integrase
MGTVYAKGGRLYIGFKDSDGEWTYKASGYPVGEEDKAKKLLDKIERQIAAGVELTGEKDAGPLTVRCYAGAFIERRKRLGIEDWPNDEARLRDHVLAIKIGDGEFGALPVARVRPRHIIAVIEAAKVKLAPKTIYNVYSVCKALFRDAVIDDHLEASPCILTKYHLGENVDKDPEWRDTALFSREELVEAISNPLVPWDRQMLYALEGIAALRHGEAAGRRWRHWNRDVQPLTGLQISTSYDKDRTKTKKTRHMPVHPVLEAMLREWHDVGWPQMMGREPTPDDLIVPMPKSRRVTLGKMRTKNDSFKRLKLDLAQLGYRHRRGHDWRRTMISLAVGEDGARKEVLERGTHTTKRGQRSNAIDSYLTVNWKPLCEEVLKFRVWRRPPSDYQAGAANSPMLPAAFTTDLLPQLVSIEDDARKTVEAPGVEPGSESAAKRPLRACSADLVSRSAVPTDRPCRPLARPVFSRRRRRALRRR